MSQPGTNTSPLFETTANDIVRRMEARPFDPAAAGIAAEARVLAAEFRRWQSIRPDGPERLSAIQRLMALTERAGAASASLPSHPPGSR